MGSNFHPLFVVLTGIPCFLIARITVPGVEQRSLAIRSADFLSYSSLSHSRFLNLSVVGFSPGFLSSTPAA